ncbi:MAG: hypothetical protein ACHQVS_04865 [Candidatus Babeliales bacterium]
MKVKLILILIASCIGTLHAGSFKLADITTPAKKACNDIACNVAKHPGALALTGVVAGCLIYTHADREWGKAHKAFQELESLRARVNDNNFYSNDYENRSEQFKKAIQAYEKAQVELRDLENKNLGSVRARSEHTKRTYKSLPKNFSASDLERAKTEAEQAEQELKTKEAETRPTLEKAKERVTEARAALDSSFTEELKSLNAKVLLNYYKNLWQIGACIAVASATSYGIYKAWPRLTKWLAAYAK